MIKTVLFDLDGTLLPMDQDAFTIGYFKLLSAKLAPHGYEPKQLTDAIWAGTGAMVKNDGSRSNEEAFWEKFSEIYGKEKAVKDLPLFDEFYSQDFSGAKAFCGYNPLAEQAVQKAKRLGFQVALATNPIFPKTATESRIRWAGLAPEDFELYTTYEDVCYCKPNPKYYQAILKTLDVQAMECLMVGNDVTEDMIAETIGMNVFLLTDCMINKEQKDISVYPHGDFSELMNFLEGLSE